MELQRKAMQLCVLGCVFWVGSAHGQNISQNVTAYEGEIPICKPGGGGLWFPAFAGEQEWNKGLRGFLYFLGMIYSFAGVALFADSFMCAIETITSKEKTVESEDGEQQFVRVWNPTVANLTLMALGSSAPEILLSLIEVSGNQFFSGALGPSTIVGSAAFNLLVILSVCICAVPTYKALAEHKVYLVTASASVFAYVWLVIILIISSPDAVEVWEALLTALFFPALVIISYMIDANKLCFNKSQQETDEHITQIEHRGRTLTGTRSEQLQARFAVAKEVERRRGSSSGNLKKIKKAVEEGYKEQDPEKFSPEEQHEYIKKLDKIHKHRGQSRAFYRVFSIRKMFTGSDMDHEEADHATLADTKIASPEPNFSFNNEDPGEVTFTSKKVYIMEGSGNTDQPNPTCYLEILREKAGKDCKEIEIKYDTVNGSAVAGKDFIKPSGSVTMAAGELRTYIEIMIIDDNIFELDESFFIKLTGVDYKDSSESKATDLGRIEKVEVVILNDDHVKTFQDKVVMLLHLNAHKFKLGSDEWGQKIAEAIHYDSSWSLPRKVSSVIMLPWRLMNALSPPTTMMGAYPAFVCSLGLIAIATVMIGDLAALFGCVIGLSDTITAITFVALGTSLPDTFASRNAAIHELTADAAVTNVTGSNSVNVFLGLGLSWSLAAIYWRANGPTDEWKNRVPASVQKDFPEGVFYVKSGDLGFGVVVFTLCTLVAFATLHVQRLHGGELGGPYRYHVAALFVSMWVLYVVLSSLVSEGMIDSF